MTSYQKEETFFHHIGGVVREFVHTRSGPITYVTHKSVGDFATSTDVGVEQIIVAELQKAFPSDKILAEEGYAGTGIATGRMWIIDPICGTTNLAREIRNYCTNIALSDSGEVIASLVIDHSTGDSLWSIGNGVCVNTEAWVAPTERYDTVIDVDFGGTMATTQDMRLRHIRCLQHLVQNEFWYITSLNSSLAFAYTAIHKLDGFVNTHNNPWDIAAAAFLVQQAGGTITSLEGEPWSLQARGAIAGKSTEIHQTLLNAYRASAIL